MDNKYPNGKSMLSTHYLALLILFISLSPQAFASFVKTQALYVWTGDWDVSGNLPSQEVNVVSDESLKMQLLNRAVASGIDIIFISMFHYPENTDNSRMYELSDISSFIHAAHQRGIEVWQMYSGDKIDVTRWNELCGSGGCDDLSSAIVYYPQRRIDDFVSYNQANPDNTFDGLMLDIEPKPQTQQDFVDFLIMIEGIQNEVEEQINKPTAIAIPQNYDTVVTYKNASKNAYKHMIDLDLGYVAIGGYWESSPTVIGYVEDEIAYASNIGKAGYILPGIETQDCSITSKCSVENSVYEEGQVLLNQIALDLQSHFQDEIGFGGVGLHKYGGAYLSGESADWPTVNQTLGNTLASKILEDTPIGYWQFEDENNMGLSETGTYNLIAKDSSGNTVTSITQVDGLHNGSIGSKAVELAGDFYFELPNSSNFDVSNGYTLEGIVCDDSLYLVGGNGSVIFNKSEYTGSTTTEPFYVSIGNAYQGNTSTSFGAWVNKESNFGSPDTRWNHWSIYESQSLHFALAYEPGDPNVTGDETKAFYVNGNLVTNIQTHPTGSFPTATANNAPITIGMGINPSNGSLSLAHAIYDEFALYDKALTASDIQSHYDAASLQGCSLQ